jgi:hypothetical protein
MKRHILMHRPFLRELEEQNPPGSLGGDKVQKSIKVAFF